MDEFDYVKRFIEQLEFLLENWNDEIKTTEISMTKETMQKLLKGLKERGN